LVDLYFKTEDIAEEFNNIIFGLGKSVNDEQYLDYYTSQTEEIQREDRENAIPDDDYHQEMYNPHYQNYYNMSNDDMGYQRDHNAYMQPAPLLHPTPHVAHMGYGHSTSPNIHTNYAMPNAGMEYQDRVNYTINNPMAFQQMNANKNPNDMNNYMDEGSY
jgi:hypothetical protein